MFEGLVVLNTVTSAVFLYWTGLRLRRGFGLFSNSIPFAYVLTNGLFIFSNQAASAVYEYRIPNWWVERSIYANLMFMGLSVLIIAWRRGTWGRGHVAVPSTSVLRTPSLRVNRGMLLFLIPIAIAFEARYLFMSGGIERMFELAYVSGRDSLYAARYDPLLAIEEGQGLFSAQIALKVMYPLCALGIAYLALVQRKYLYAILGAPLFVLSGMTALSSLQRSPPIVFSLISLSAVIWAMYARHQQVKSTGFVSGKAILLIMAMFLIGGSVYAFTEEQNLLDGLYGLLERSLLITSFSGTSYYGIFGQYVPFQGVYRMLGLSTLGYGPEISIADVGRIANGYSHNLNANFVATAYAGTGYIGVCSITVLVLLVSRYLDRLIARYNSIDRAAILLLNAFMLFEICNGPLMNGLLVGFVSNVYLYVLMFHRRFAWRSGGVGTFESWQGAKTRHESEREGRLGGG